MCEVSYAKVHRIKNADKPRERARGPTIKKKIKRYAAVNNVTTVASVPSTHTVMAFIKCWKRPEQAKPGLARIKSVKSHYFSNKVCYKSSPGPVSRATTSSAPPTFCPPSSSPPPYFLPPPISPLFSPSSFPPLLLPPSLSPLPFRPPPFPPTPFTIVDILSYYNRKRLRWLEKLKGFWSDGRFLMASRCFHTPNTWACGGAGCVVAPRRPAVAKRRNSKWCWRADGARHVPDFLRASQLHIDGAWRERNLSILRW